MQGFDSFPPVLSGETVKIKDGFRWPYLSTDRNHLLADTTRALGEHLRQVSKKNDQWSRRRCDNQKKFTDGRTYRRTNGRTDVMDEWTPDGPLLDKEFLESTILKEIQCSYYQENYHVFFFFLVHCICNLKGG